MIEINPLYAEIKIPEKEEDFLADVFAEDDTLDISPKLAQIKVTDEIGKIQILGAFFG